MNCIIASFSSWVNSSVFFCVDILFSLFSVFHQENSIYIMRFCKLQIPFLNTP